jgi:hypothetical protein
VAGEDPVYARILRTIACRLAYTGRCTGAIEVHHPTHLRHTGHDGRRAHDHEAIPLCHGHHVVELHGLNGFFREFVRAGMRAWHDEEIRAVQALAMPLLKGTLPGDAL